MKWQSKTAIITPSKITKIAPSLALSVRKEMEYNANVFKKQPELLSLRSTRKKRQQKRQQKQQ